ncbi:MAG: FGGY-family carbohydrate kinase [Myxococcota bacterium]|nr:FGGY-family carbohydrate kinase [Myxococcota bacterium]
MGSRRQCVLAVDHGTSGVKSSLVTTAGEIISTEIAATPITFLPHGGAEQDPELWWQGLIATAARLVAKGVVPVADIIAVCCSSTFSSTVAVDRHGRHLGNSLTWMDSRGAPFIRNLVSGFPSVHGYGLFKMIPWLAKTGGGPQLSGKDDIAHVLWWKNQQPDVYDKAHMFMGSKDYLNLRLTGEFAASYDAMTLFWVVNSRDINALHYDDGLLKRVGIDRSKLPPMRRSIDVLGKITPEVAALTGLSQDTPVVTGSPDHQCACIGSGAVQDFQGHLYIGTSSWIQCVVPFKKTDSKHSIAAIPSAIPGRYYAVNEQDIAAGILPYLVDNWLFNNRDIQGSQVPGDIYDRIEASAAKIEPGAGNLIFTPWLNGERTPVDNTALRGSLFNISMSTTMDHILRAALEGVAYNNRWALKYVETFIRRKMDSLAIIGGGARSDLWCQILADVMDRTLRRPKDPVQANARGAAFLASVGLGHITFDDIGDLVHWERTFEPDPKNRRVYDSLFEQFIALYKKNKRTHKRLNR